MIDSLSGMSYSLVGILAILVLLIENNDVIFNRNRAFVEKSWKVYRLFLIAVLLYYFTDVLWGFLEGAKLTQLLFADTTVYFIAMACGVLLWSQYTITYLEDNSIVGRIFALIGYIITGFITLSALINIFVPILFTVDGDCVYTAFPFRYTILGIQVLFLVMISVFAFILIIKNKEQKRKKHLALAFFGLIMAIFLTIQLWFPYLPLYTIAYMLGTCVLHAFLVDEEKDNYRLELEKAYERERELGTVYAHISLSLARGYTDLYYVNMETDEFIEYRTDDEMRILTEARRGDDFFEGCDRDAKYFVHKDDQQAFVSAMKRDFLEKALEHNKVFELVYRRIKDGETF